MAKEYPGAAQNTHLCAHCHPLEPPAQGQRIREVSVMVSTIRYIQRARWPRTEICASISLHRLCLRLHTAWERHCFGHILCMQLDRHSGSEEELHTTWIECDGGHTRSPIIRGAAASNQSSAKDDRLSGHVAIERLAFFGCMPPVCSIDRLSGSEEELHTTWIECDRGHTRSPIIRDAASSNQSAAKNDRLSRCR
jgi:hypothetical protein